jgi:hypothetical protein
MRAAVLQHALEDAFRNTLSKRREYTFYLFVIYISKFEYGVASP